MPSDPYAGLPPNWRRQRSESSFICTPRNARILAAYQRLGGPDGGPYSGDLAIDQFDEGLPYLYEARPALDGKTVRFKLIDAEKGLLTLIKAKRDQHIHDFSLAGAETIWADGLTEAFSRIAPTVTRFALKVTGGAPRHFENLSLPLLAPGSETAVDVLIGSLDEIGAEGPHIRPLQWKNVMSAHAMHIGVAHPLDG